MWEHSHGEQTVGAIESVPVGFTGLLEESERHGHAIAACPS